MSASQSLTTQVLLDNLERKYQTLQYDHHHLTLRRVEIDAKLSKIETAEAEVYDQIVTLRFRLGIKI